MKALFCPFKGQVHADSTRGGKEQAPTCGVKTREKFYTKLNISAPFCIKNGSVTVDE